MVSGTYYILEITEDLKELLLCELYIYQYLLYYKFKNFFNF